MPINCLIKFLINFWTVMFQKSIHGQFVNNSWTLMFQKDGPFAFRLSSFVSSSPFLSFPLSSSPFLSFPLLFLSFPLLLSFFNVHPTNLANSLKTKDLKKRHFWLQIFESRETAKTQNVRRKFAQWFAHFPATLHSTRSPKLTLHAPPRNPAPCKVLCRICRPNPTHLTPLIIKS